MAQEKGKWGVVFLHELDCWAVEKEGHQICELRPSHSASSALSSEEHNANAHLIVEAVNACIEINPDNPMAVAESISDMKEALTIGVKLVNALILDIEKQKGKVPSVEVLMARTTMEHALAEAKVKVKE